MNTRRSTLPQGSGSVDYAEFIMWTRLASSSKADIDPAMVWFYRQQVTPRAHACHREGAALATSSLLHFVLWSVLALH